MTGVRPQRREPEGGRPMATMAEKVKRFLSELSLDGVEERVVEYVIREVHNGRRLEDALNDPYVRNRVNEDKLARVLENPEIASAIEAQIAEAFKKHEFDFLD